MEAYDVVIIGAGHNALVCAGTHPGGSISGLPGRNCARVFLHKEEPITQTLKEAGDTIKSTVLSVFKGVGSRE